MDSETESNLVLLSRRKICISLTIEGFQQCFDGRLKGNCLCTVFVLFNVYRHGITA